MRVPVAEDHVPTYQYACTACGHRFEAVQSFSDSSLTDCPECAGRLRKVFSSVGIVFKGSGFYRTDSRAKDGAAAAGAKDSSGGEKSSDSSASSGSSDTGAAAKKEPAKASDSGAKTSGSTSSTSTPATTGS
jgi:putative FmdB family regulatory protein